VPIGPVIISRHLHARADSEHLHSSPHPIHTISALPRGALDHRSGQGFRQGVQRGGEVRRKDTKLDGKLSL
jgi:hypothetical protein